ncbi:HAD hydrolase-like protein [Sansalvadorimonas sp. 2012CJ34-2]|uniref:HAD hydrolase-like protein n=1 Tax=Parendozoicomonas callyspongiae TaxID=2942213 RepID=A0ABT0PLQ5_9GAMM|nr:HAD hydrolase-like protein [Sansalvadorimonas sp. 2012CJ34-2]MCL6271378.1 HAD hydrolase-like protein [Sansalvadorimonas sp. 2012CJ34-2]
MTIKLLFDLDGTISDPLEGIIRSTNFALEHFGYSPKTAEDIAQYIGPPLDESLMDMTGQTDPKIISTYVAKYRERYVATGYRENTLYPDIPNALESLSQRNIPMAICTSKRADIADHILKMFGLRNYFQFISGGDVGIQKWQQIERLVDKNLVDKDTTMIGDRAVDIIAAQKNGLKSAGVLWGYGSLAELQSKKPNHILSSPAELKELAAQTTRA